MPRTVRALMPIVVSMLLLASCSSGGSDAADDTADRADASTTTTAATAEPAGPTGDLADCPAGYRDGDLDAGRHDDFSSGGQERSFHLLLPEDAGDEPAPLFVALTGTVQEEVAFLKQSELDQLPKDGWIVVTPVRENNGKVWGPWDAMRPTSMTGPNPDTTLILDLISCLSAHHAVDADRVFVGGISIGGTFVNFLLRHFPDVFAGGIVGSGNFILTEPPKPEPLGSMTVIVAWGGDVDHWTGCPDGRMGEEFKGVPGCASVDFVKDAHDAAAFYDAEDDVAMLACTEDLGHIWNAGATAYWAAILAARPKGTTKPIEVGTPPGDLRCSTDVPE